MLQSECCVNSGHPARKAGGLLGQQCIVDAAVKLWLFGRVLEATSAVISAWGRANLCNQTACVNGNFFKHSQSGFEEGCCGAQYIAAAGDRLVAWRGV